MIENLTKRLTEGISGLCRVNMRQKTNLPIRSSEMGALIYITHHAREDGVKSIELSNYFGIQKSSVSTMITSLEKKGYIKRTVSIKDKRSSPFFPTEKGNQLVNETIDEYHQMSKRIINEIGEEKCEEFLKTIQQVTKIIENGDV